LLLELRGRLSRDQRRILHVDPFQRALADRADVAAVATAARATPDHILRIGHASAVIRSAAEIDSVIDDFEQDYIAYFERNRHRLPARQTMLNPLPKVLLVPGLGCVAAGSDVRAARVNTEIAYRSHLVTATTLDVFGESAWLSEADIFDFEYWPLELAKLASAPAPRSFAGHVVIITGASSHDGPAVAQRLAAEGAHLVLVVDDPTSLAQPAASLSSDATLYVSPATDIVGATIEQFGGVDGLILLAPPTDAPLDRFVAAIVQQRLSGVVVAVGSADELATIGNRVSAAVSIRVNAIDATVDANPSDVAEAVAFLASDHARATRESVISVGAR
jgi:hypothetical protein